MKIYSPQQWKRKIFIGIKPISPQLISVQPISPPTNILYYLDFIYENTKIKREKRTNN